MMWVMICHVCQSFTESLYNYDVGVFGVIVCIHGTVYELAVYMKELIIWFTGTIYTNN